MLPAAPVDPAARVVAVDPVVRVVRADQADQAARAVAVADVTITEVAAAPADLAALADRAALAAPVVRVVPVVPVAAVGSVAPVGAETPLGRSASRAVVRPEVESPSAPSVKSSTTWKLRRSAAFGCPGVRVRRSGSRAVRR